MEFQTNQCFLGQLGNLRSIKLIMEKTRKTARSRKQLIHQKETISIVKETAKSKVRLSKLLFIPLIIFLIVFIFPHLPLVKKVETGQMKNNDYTARKIAVFEEINPKNGFQSKIQLGDIVPKLVSYGVIDMTKMQNLYQGRGGIPKEEMELLTKASNKPLVISASNANWIVNLLWAIGLSNKMEINKESPIFGPDLNNFASTGGWNLGKEDSGGAYFNKYSLIPLNSSQQKRVKMIAENTYRPCCNNSTFFQDCNHGSAGMAIIELGVSEGLSDDDIYKTLLAFNAFWFPQNYNEIALYFNVIKKTDWHDVDPKLALSKDYSSITGWMKNVDTAVAKVPGLLPKSQSSGSCGT